MSARLSQMDKRRVRRLVSEAAAAAGTKDVDVLRELADIFASAALGLPHPAKSIAKRVAYYVGQGLPPGRVQAVMELANEQVEEMQAAASASVAPPARFLTSEQVAPLLDLSARVLEKLLVDWQFRRDCGWPQWMRGRWYFHPDAFGIRKPEYFARLPRREPYPLPPFCTPQPAEEPSVVQPGAGITPTREPSDV